METGFDAIEKAVKDSAAARSRAGSGTGLWLPYFGWKDDDSGKRTQVIRFLDDKPIVADFYDNIICADGWTRDFIYDPDKGDFIKKFGAKAKSWAPGGGVETPESRKAVAGIAVLREEIRGDKPGEVSFRDAPHTVKWRDNKSGSEVEYEARYFGIVKQSLGNFWDTMIGYVGRYGTLCDRDYEITRSGSGFDTKYRIIPMEVDPELDSCEKVQAYYRYGQARDQDDANRFMFCPVTLKQWGEEKSSEEYAERWLKDANPTAPASTDEAQTNGGYTPSGMDQFARKSEDKVDVPTTGGSLRDKLLNEMGDK